MVWRSGARLRRRTKCPDLRSHAWYGVGFPDDGRLRAGIVLPGMADRVLQGEGRW
jgi:hypothetical protein